MFYYIFQSMQQYVFPYSATRFSAAAPFLGLPVKFISGLDAIYYC
jgi:hypothetical protein